MENDNELRSRPAGSCHVTLENETIPLLDTSFSTANQSPSANRPPSTDRRLTADMDSQDGMENIENRGVTTITKAVKLGQEDKMLEILASFPAEKVHEEVRSNLLLHEAIDKSTPKVLEMLLEKLNKKSNNSCEDKQLETSEQINAQDSDGYTTLHKAAIKKKPKMLKLLIENGGKGDTKNGRDQTPLHIAAWKGSAECTDILIDTIREDQLKTYLDSVDNNKATALMRAAKYSHLRVCKKLSASNVNLQDIEGDTALHHAARSGSRAVVEFLLSKCNADSSIKNKKGELAVETAVSGGKDDAGCFKVLLEKTMMQENMSSYANLLKEATLSKSIKCLKQMLMREDFRKLINYKFTDDDNTILHYSLIEKHYEIAKVLLEQKPAKNLSNKRQELSAHLLAMIPPSEYQDEDHVRTVRKRIMKDLNEDIERKNIEGKNLLDLAVASGNEEMIQHLLWFQCSRVSGVLEAARLGKECILKRLLKALPANQAQEMNKETPHPLHLAAKSGHLRCCAALIDTFKEPALSLYNRVKSTAGYFFFMDRQTNAPDPRLVDTKNELNLLLIEDENRNYPVDLAYNENHFDVFRFLLQKMQFQTELKNFAYRLHKYCEESVNDNISERMTCIETIVDSEWCRVAFDSKYCQSWLAVREEEQRTQAKPLCKSLAKLVRGFPHLACKILDQHIILPRTEEIEKEIKEESHHFEGHEKHDYAPFEPMITTNVKDNQNQTNSVMWKCKSHETISWENHPLLASLHTENKEVLTHHLSKSWLSYKYNEYAKLLLYVCVALDALSTIFTSSMFGLLRNTYQLEIFYNGTTRMEIMAVYDTYSPLDSTDPTIRSMVQEIQATSSTDPKCSFYDVSTTTGMDLESGLHPPPGTATWNRTVCAIVQLQQKTGWVVGLQVMVIIMLFINVFIGMFLLIRLQRKHIFMYLKGFNLIRCALLVLLFVNIVLQTYCDFILGMRQEYVWMCGLLSVLLAWMNLIITLSRIPTLTGYMQISGKFFTTYVKGISFFLLIIMAFALTFHFMLQTEGRAFSTIPYSIVKTMVWMFGEFDYTETFIENDLPLKYQIFSNCLFTLFITVIVGFISNVILSSPKALLEEIREKTEFNRAKTSLMLVYFVDLGFPFLRRPFDRKLVESKRTHHSTPSTSSLPRQTSVSLKNRDLCHQEILERLQQMKDDISQLNQMKDDISQLTQMKDDFKDVTQLVRDLHSSVQSPGTPLK